VNASSQNVVACSVHNMGIPARNVSSTYPNSTCIYILFM